ncbi:lipopolysaccharide biosynthesis protein [Botrimarina sp.]|uniref:lipopolysaccharide biosynthesis protein n=1 Tax=Botrimarina sp. TaxID=2795802 RepID=UPI0032ED092B
MAEPAPRVRRRATLGPETLLSSLAVVLAVSVLQRTIGFGRSLLFCRWLDAEQLGRWEMAYGFLILAAPLAVLGLPGSFGRYLEKHRQSGQLGVFLRRTTTWTLLLAGSTLAVMAWRRETVAALVFGDASRAALAGGVVACLGLVILHHYFEAVFAGLRMYRVVSTMHFTQSVSFAVVSLALVAFWRPAAASIVIGYASGCLISILLVAVAASMRVESGPPRGEAVAHAAFWPPLMRFAFWVWVTNLLTNVFSTCDRYMIIHYGGFDADRALVQVGNYHTSTIVPVLLVSIANLMVGAMTPHLSHDWECGRRDEVAARLNLALKLGALAMLAAGAAILTLAPALFQYAFENKYAAGLAVMPWTISACVWFALLLVAQQYLWCAEKSRLATAPLAVGLVANLGLNLVLLPRWGLLGAVVATAAATLLTLLAQLVVNRRCGMAIDRGAVLVAFCPALLAAGAMPATAGAIGLGALALLRGWVFTDAERADITAAAMAKLTPLAARFRRAA